MKYLILTILLTSLGMEAQAHWKNGKPHVHTGSLNTVDHLTDSAGITGAGRGNGNSDSGRQSLTEAFKNPGQRGTGGCKLKTGPGKDREKGDFDDNIQVACD